MDDSCVLPQSRGRGWRGVLILCEHLQPHDMHAIIKADESVWCAALGLAFVRIIFLRDI